MYFMSTKLIPSLNLPPQILIIPKSLFWDKMEHRGQRKFDNKIHSVLNKAVANSLCSRMVFRAGDAWLEFTQKFGPNSPSHGVSYRYHKSDIGSRSAQIASSSQLRFIFFRGM